MSLLPLTICDDSELIDHMTDSKEPYDSTSMVTAGAV